ncbi:MAG TPA: NADH-ubiquinone oxidoreductase-F iron-sulfur binding region domain-containing protein [Acidimicrobiales bacterium]
MNATLPRVLLGATGRPLSLAEHESTFATPVRPSGLFDELEASGLTGRGGGAFPTSRKVALIRNQRGHGKVVVVNAMEGEPEAHKDRTLLSTNPHLVLDGAEYLAALIGAKTVAVCVPRDNPTVVHYLKRAIFERTLRTHKGPTFELHDAPWRYVAGEESALVHWLNDNESLPQYRASRTHVLRVGRGPALVDNAETCAHVALIGRFGAAWFRELGTATSPGSALVSLTGAVDRPKVLEVSLGTTLAAILDAGNADAQPQALLTGGYGGTWLAGNHLNVPYANETLAPVGAMVGTGVLVVLPRSGCGLLETKRVVDWMANESARQCGPCAFGLPALAEDLTHLLHARPDGPTVLARLIERCGVIEGRGACRHPDGVVRMVRSALSVFAVDIERHAQGSMCEGAKAREHWVTVPSIVHEDELVWQ